MAKRDKEITFSADELEALKVIASDWLNERLVTPPFDKATEAVLEKLGLASRDERKGLKVSPETLDKMSEQAAIRPAER